MGTCIIPVQQNNSGSPTAEPRSDQWEYNTVYSTGRYGYRYYTDMIRTVGILILSPYYPYAV
jgi:hypothetical protein